MHFGVWSVQKEKYMEFSQWQYKSKSREELIEEGFNYQWLYLQLSERFKIDKNYIYGFEKEGLEIRCAANE